MPTTEGVARNEARGDSGPVATPRTELVGALDQLLIQLPQDEAQDVWASIALSSNEVGTLLRARSNGVKALSSNLADAEAGECTDLEPDTDGRGDHDLPEIVIADLPAAGRSTSMLRASLENDTANCAAAKTRDSGSPSSTGAAASSPPDAITNGSGGVEDAAPVTAGAASHAPAAARKVPKLALDSELLPASDGAAFRQSQAVGIELWGVSEVKLFLERLGYKSLASTAGDK